MRCPSCGAHNGENALLCSLCQTPLVELRSTPASPADAGATEGAAADDEPDISHLLEAPLGGEATPRPVRTVEHERFRRTEEGFDWRCRRCQEWNPIELVTCSVCQLPFRDALGDQESGPKAPDVPPTTALVLTVVAPGLGHVAIGRAGLGVSRLVLYAVFLLGGLLFLGESGEASSAVLAVIPLLSGALAVWLTTLIDLRSALSGRSSTVLPARAYLWMTVAVVVMVLLSGLPALFRA